MNPDVSHRLSSLLASLEADVEHFGKVYDALAQHQLDEQWCGQDAMAVLQQWAGRFIAEFKLGVSEVVLRIDRLPVSTFTLFRPGHNGFGLRGDIAINARYLNDGTDEWKVLGALLYELVHAWQQSHGVPGKGRITTVSSGTRPPGSDYGWTGTGSSAKPR